MKDEPSSSQIANDVATAQMGKKKAFKKEGAAEDLRIKLNEGRIFAKNQISIFFSSKMAPNLRVQSKIDI